jgi:hypothetical protein
LPLLSLVVVVQGVLWALQTRSAASGADVLVHSTAEHTFGAAGHAPAAGPVGFDMYFPALARLSALEGLEWIDAAAVVCAIALVLTALSRAAPGGGIATRVVAPSTKSARSGGVTTTTTAVPAPLFSHALRAALLHGAAVGYVSGVLPIVLHARPHLPVNFYVCMAVAASAVVSAVVLRAVWELREAPGGGVARVGDVCGGRPGTATMVGQGSPNAAKSPLRNPPLSPGQSAPLPPAAADSPATPARFPWLGFLGLSLIALAQLVACACAVAMGHHKWSVWTGLAVLACFTFGSVHSAWRAARLAGCFAPAHRPRAPSG